MGVRVTRLMEYEYESVEAALTDMDHWGVPPNGVQRWGSLSPTVRSSVIGPVFGEAADRIHTALAADEVDLRPATVCSCGEIWRLGKVHMSDHPCWVPGVEPPPVEDVAAAEAIVHLVGVWRGMGPDLRTKVRRLSEDLYNALGTVSTLTHVRRMGR